MTTPARILALPASVALLSVTTLADAPEIQTLKNLKFASIEVPDSSITEARGINSLGETVGFWQDEAGRGHGFLLSGGVYRSIDIPDAVLTVASDINDAGDIVGTYHEPAGPGELFGDSHGFLLSAADGQLTTITFPGQQVTWVTGINNHGQIVGGYSRWNGDQVLGVHGFILAEGTFTRIDFPVPETPAHVPVTYAIRINNAGDIVGGYNDDIYQTRRGFVLRDGLYTTFDVPGSGFTDLYAANNAGAIAGEYLDIDGQVYGFLFSPDRGFHRLAGTGNPKERITSLVPFGLNDSGQIAGSGVTASGSLNGFVAEPPTGWLSEPVLFSRVR
ncbi:MAG: hypothetical protein ACRD3C_26755 [Vicinamibacterales bacterium]